MRSETAGRLLDHMGDHVGTTLTAQGAYDAVGDHADATAIDQALAELQAERLIVWQDPDPNPELDHDTSGYVLTQAGLEETGADL